MRRDQTVKASNKDIKRPNSQYISDRYFGQSNILESEQQLQLLIRNNITDWYVSSYVNKAIFIVRNIIILKNTISDVITISNVCRVEQELLARIVSEAGNTYYANNTSNVDSSSQTEESSSRNSEAELCTLLFNILI